MSGLFLITAVARTMRVGDINQDSQAGQSDLTTSNPTFGHVIQSYQTVELTHALYGLHLSGQVFWGRSVITLP